MLYAEESVHNSVVRFRRSRVVVFHDTVVVRFRYAGRTGELAVLLEMVDGVAAQFVHRVQPELDLDSLVV